MSLLHSHDHHGHGHGHGHGHDHHHAPPAAADAPPGYRRVLWIALAVNALLFAIEIGAGLSAHSVSLLADAIDFLGDAFNYGLSLYVLALSALWRARAAQLKAWSMIVFGVAVLARAAWAAWSGGAPEPLPMAAVALLALAANVGVAVLLYAFREGDANMRGVWLCSRNDAIGNVAVLLAAVGVFGTGTRWPDLLVAAGMAGLALTAGLSVLRQAHGEVRAQRTGARVADRAGG